MYQAIIFDLDGTLWNTIGDLSKLINEEIEKFQKQGFKINKVDEQQIQSILGLTTTEIVQTLFPNVDSTVSSAVVGKVVENELKYFRKYGAILYPDVEEVLQYLNNKYKVFLVSNCQKGYIESFLEHYEFDKYFQDQLCFGDTLESKGRNIKSIMKKNNIEKAIYVGDTTTDYIACVESNIDFIYVTYGHGYCNKYTYKINNLLELKEIV